MSVLFLFMYKIPALFPQQIVYQDNIENSIFRAKIDSRLSEGQVYGFSF